jgi:hypothetical protein
MDMAEETAFVGLTEGGAGGELSDSADVVQERRSEQEIRAKTRVQLRRLAAECRDPDRVLEQPAGVRVVCLRSRQAPQRRAHRVVREETLHHGRETGMDDLGGEELEKAVQLFGVAPHRGREVGRVGLGRGLEGAHVDLEPVAELLDSAEHPHCVALGEAGVEELDVVPDAGVDSPARVDELERKVWRAALRPHSLLARDRVNPFDDPFLGQLCDCAHVASLGPRTDARVAEMAVVKPFRAERYDEQSAGPLEQLVAPPYDVISPEERSELLAKSPYNVVHLTLPDTEEEAGAAIADWRRRGVLARDEESAYWFLSQDYVGPDGVARNRSGLVASLRAEPYENRVVLPHERTHSGPKEGRLRLLRATRTELEPIFLLYEGDPVEPPAREADLQSGGDKLWRIGDAPSFEQTELLIADGHHRYETALAYAQEGGSPYLMVVLVPTRQEGLTIFPTHRVAEHVNGAGGTPIDEPGDELPGVVLYRDGRYELLTGDGLDVDIVERIAPQGVTYTSQRGDAVATVDRGDAEAAFLLRPTRIEDVWEVARRGDTMPQKSTYFFPKLTSGLLFHPLD